MSESVTEKEAKGKAEASYILNQYFGEIALSILFGIMAFMFGFGFMPSFLSVVASIILLILLPFVLFVVGKIGIAFIGIFKKDQS